MASSTASTAAATAAKASALARQQIAPRSISISVSPPPVNFAERRAVLQVLKQHGGVEFFKSVPGHDSMFISLMKDREAVSRLVTTSPFLYAVSIPKSAPETALSAVYGRDGLSKLKPVTRVKTQGTLASSESKQESPEKQFTIQVWPHPEYRHHISSRSVLHRAWPDVIGKNDSFITKILKQSLPKTMVAKGLANWEPDLGKQRTFAGSKNKMQERIQLISSIPGKMLKAAAPREYCVKYPSLASGTHQAQAQADYTPQMTNLQASRTLSVSHTSDALFLMLAVAPLNMAWLHWTAPDLGTHVAHERQLRANAAQKEKICLGCNIDETTGHSTAAPRCRS
ncbi:hypothetical protein AK830_g10272 [Neonectria ditissima]|uniref:Pal1-like protein n=1 Tax=Neonectria ditissima TaxID=78410 RepID=A0A0P7B722_9HYPO|nr:hypothetical protein AK830_g10272 [Neonectria ditissima]